MAKSTSAPAIVEFASHLRSIQSAEYDSFRAKAGTLARNSDEFERQRAHLLHYYDGVTVLHSFEDDFGNVFDCVPMDQQPAAKYLGGKAPAEPPALPTPSFQTPSLQAILAGELPRAPLDRHGNRRACPDGSVAIRRLTLDELSRFATIEDFFRGARRKRKHFVTKPEAPDAAADDPEFADYPHRYAVAYQQVQNFGGQSALNLWDPSITGGQIMSLSQQWYSAGDEGNNTLQTAEAGWQVCPNNFPNAGSQPVFFVFWTADNYQTTGAYNNRDGKFYIKSSTAIIGAVWETISVQNGTQYDRVVSYKFSQGNWCLYLDGDLVGYWPGAIYNGGPMSHAAQEIMFGGETDGNADYPPMGSGNFAAQGYGYAAYQRNISYFDQNGQPVNAALLPDQPTPASYTVGIGVPAAPDAAAWGSYIFFGGAGGV